MGRNIPFQGSSHNPADFQSRFPNAQSAGGGSGRADAE